MYTSFITSQLSQFNSTQLNITLVDSEGIMPKQSLTCNMPGENNSSDQIQAFLNNIITNATSQYAQQYSQSVAANIDYYAVMQNTLDTYVGPNTYNTVIKTLNGISSTQVSLNQNNVQLPNGVNVLQPNSNQNITLNVTSLPPLNPIDYDTHLQTGIDSQLGSGSYATIKSVLGSMGFKNVTINSQTVINLT